MAELELEPYAASVHWHFAAARPPETWQQMLTAFLDNLGMACTADSKCVLGHIKFFARLPHGGYLRGSKLSPHYPADLEVKGGTSPFAQLQMSLNVLVYGLPLQEAQQFVRQVGTAAAAEAGGEMEIFTAQAEHQHEH